MANPGQPTVFISSTVEDLEPYRDAVRDGAIRAGYAVDMCEYWNAQGERLPVAGVPRVISLGSSSRLYPTASFAAILASGNPVALLARALDRLTRGFISMITIRSDSGSIANWTFDPPVSTPISRMQAIVASRIR